MRHSCNCVQNLAELSIDEVLYNMRHSSSSRSGDPAQVWIGAWREAPAGLSTAQIPEGKFVAIKHLQLSKGSGMLRNPATEEELVQQREAGGGHGERWAAAAVCRQGPVFPRLMEATPAAFVL